MKSAAIVRDVSGTTATAGTPADLWRRVWALGQRMLRLSGRAPRRLRLCESLPLGERRFVAVVEFERSRFLVGGTSGSLVLLATLGNEREELVLPANPTNDISGRAQ